MTRRVAHTLAILLACTIGPVAAFAQPQTGGNTTAVTNPLKTTDCLEMFLWAKWFQFLGEGKLRPTAPLNGLPDSPYSYKAPVWKLYVAGQGKAGKWELLDATIVERMENGDVWVTTNVVRVQICPRPSTPGSTTPGTTPGGAGSASGGGGASGSGSGGSATPPVNDGDQCNDAVKRAAIQYNEAKGAVTILEQKLDQANADVKKAKAIVDRYDAALQDPTQQQQLSVDVEFQRKVIDARREAGDLEGEIRTINDALDKAKKARDKAAEELRKLGKDPQAFDDLLKEECDPKEGFMMGPAGPNNNGFFASMDEPTFDTIASDSVNGLELVNAAVTNPAPTDNACCEPLVQKAAMHLVKPIQTASLSPLSGSTPIVLNRFEWVGSLASAIAQWLTRVQPVYASSSRVWRAPGDDYRASWRASAEQALARGYPRLTAVIRAIGTSQGEAFNVQIVNEGPIPAELYGESVIVEPIKRSAHDQTARAIERLVPQAKSAPAFTVEGYCVDFALAPPDKGMLFRIASPQVQARYASTKRVLQAALKLSTAGRLNPDSNPKLYVESIKQYAVWTELEHWDFQRFSDAWRSMTEKQMKAAKRPYTAQMDAALKSAAPGRWRDIQAILSAAR